MITEQEIIDIVSKQHVFFNSSATHAYDFRIDQLRKFKEGVKKFESQMITALKDDLGKSDFEASSPYILRIRCFIFSRNSSFTL